jgi:hypothetical protein
VVTLLLLSLGNASGQGVEGGPTCDTCSVSLERIQAFGRLEDEFALGFMDWKTAALSGTGGLFVGLMYHPGWIAEYDSSGAGAVLCAEPGQGPAELGTIGAMIWRPARPLWVFHSGRVSEVSAQGHVTQLGRLSATLDDIAFLANGNVAVSGSLADPAVFGHRVHEIDSNLRVVRSFDRVQQTGQRNPWDFFRVIGASPRGGLWVAQMNEYSLSYWAEGEENLTLERDADWFRPWRKQPEGSPFRTRPNPILSDLIEDEKGRLWVLISVPSESWEPVPRPRLGDVGAVQGRVVTLIEVISVEDGAVITRGVSPVNLKKSLAPGLALSVEAHFTGAGNGPHSRHDNQLSRSLHPVEMDLSSPLNPGAKASGEDPGGNRASRPGPQTPKNRP